MSHGDKMDCNKRMDNENKMNHGDKMDYKERTDNGDMVNQQGKDRQWVYMVNQNHGYKNSIVK